LKPMPTPTPPAPTLRLSGDGRSMAGYSRVEARTGKSREWEAESGSPGGGVLLLLGELASGGVDSVEVAGLRDMGDIVMEVMCELRVRDWERWRRADLISDLSLWLDACARPVGIP
jgi:hypothetical protein